MILLLDAALRSSAVLLAGLLLTTLLRQRSASLRHAVLTGTLVAAVAVVPASFLLPGVVVARPAPAAAPVPHGSERPLPAPAAVAPEEPFPQRGQVRLMPLAVLWAAGLALALGTLLIGLVQVRFIARRARRLGGGPWFRIAEELSRGMRRKVALLETDVPHMLATYGVFRPRVLLPQGAADWPAARIRIVLRHELAHVRRCDWAAQLAADMFRAVYWFNPLAWALSLQLRRHSERASDDQVLAAGVDPSEYAAHLLQLARTCRRPGPAWAATVPIAVPSTLERRITAMLSPGIDRTPPSPRALAAAALLLIAVLLPAAAVRGAQNGPRPLGGVVYDPTGAVMPEVRLILEDAQEFTWEATTDGSGRFEFPPVQPGPYTIRAEIPGFRLLRQELTLKQPRDWDRAITLQVGELQESVTVQAQRAAPRPSAETPRRVRVGGNIKVPQKVHDVHPIFPASMREAGRDGTVLLEAIIGVDGDVSSLRVLGTQVHPDFAVAATDAVRQWKFTPTLLNGTPVEVKMTVTVTFRLAD